MDMADRVVWKGKGDRYKSNFSTKETWEAIQIAKPKTVWYKGV